MVVPLFALQALALGAEFAAGVSAAKKQAGFQQALQDRSVKLAQQTAANNNEAILARQNQTRDATAISLDAARREAIRAGTTAAVASSEGGGTGVEQTAFAEQLSLFMGVKERQLLDQDAQTRRQLDAVTVQQKNGVVLAQPTTGPDPFKLAADLATSYWKTKAAFPTVKGSAIPNLPSISDQAFNLPFKL